MARVRLIEDSPLQRWMLCRQLEALGHEPLVALPLTQDNGFQCGMLLREAGVRSVLLLADVPRETDAWWARSLGLGTADGAWTVLLRPVAQQTLGLALSAALEETRHGQPA